MSPNPGAFALHILAGFSASEGMAHLSGSETAARYTKDLESVWCTFLELYMYMYVYVYVYGYIDMHESGFTVLLLWVVGEDRSLRDQNNTMASAQIETSALGTCTGKWARG